MSISGEKRLMECVSKVGVQYTVKPTFYKYSRSPTNGHFSETATFFGAQSIHWLLFKPLYIGHFFLSQIKDVRYGEVQL